jgi:hypothetical protein
MSELEKLDLCLKIFVNDENDSREFEKWQFASQNQFVAELGLSRNAITNMRKAKKVSDKFKKGLSNLFEIDFDSDLEENQVINKLKREIKLTKPEVLSIVIEFLNQSEKDLASDLAEVKKDISKGKINSSKDSVKNFNKDIIDALEIKFNISPDIWIKREEEFVKAKLLQCQTGGSISFATTKLNQEFYLPKLKKSDFENLKIKDLIGFKPKGDVESSDELMQRDGLLTKKFEASFGKSSPFITRGNWKDKNESHFMLMKIGSDVRISNFLAFTDGKKTLIHDRNQSKGDTTLVKNRKHDALGSVGFDFSSLAKKVNSDFLECEIVSMEEMRGFALEISQADIGSAQEVVIMVGYIVEVSSKDLERAIKKDSDEIFTLPINMLERNSDYTSKLNLAIQNLKDYISE